MTPGADKVLRAIYTYSRANSYPPTIAEIVQSTRLAKHTTHRALLQLERHGYIHRAPATSRARPLTPSGLLAAQGYQLLQAVMP